MGVATGLLFWDGGELRDYLEIQRQTMVEEVKRAPEEHVLQAEEDAWAQALVDRYTVETPTLLREEMYQDEPTPIDVDVSGDWSRDIRDRNQPFHIPGHRVVIRIPFSGDGQIFELKAGRYGLNPPRAAVRGQEIVDVVEYADGQPVDIRATAENLADDLERYLTWSDHDIGVYMSDLDQHARTAIRNRKERVARHRDHVAKTGLPTRRKSDGAESATYIADVLVRRPGPPLPEMSLEEPMKLEPVIELDAYNDIVATIRETAVGMARSPDTYVAMGEEDLRQVMLLPLNSRYRGQGTAEAFNVSGKTDLLIRWENANVFIAEFKIWRGEKSFLDALEQLFGYQAWRDTKLALVIFVRSRDLTSIIEKAHTALEASGQFVKWGEGADDSELRATMSWPGDDRRHATLSTVFVHLPTE